MPPTDSAAASTELDEKSQAAVAAGQAAGRAPFENWAKKYSDPSKPDFVDPFFVAAARGAYGWAQGRELSETEFREAIDRAKGLKMHASMPPSKDWKPFVPKPAVAKKPAAEPAPAKTK